MVLDKIRTLPLEQKIGQLFFIGIPGPKLDETAQALLRDIFPGGVCLFARNIREPKQTRDLLDQIRDTLPVQPFLSLDQEGGLVDRLRRIVAPMPAANRIRTKKDAKNLAAIIAETIRILGFNMDFAPVVDIIDDERGKFSNGLYSRAFGRSADDVVEMAGGFFDKLQANGVLGCLKHFPGLGASEVDSHDELPLVPLTKDELDSIDLVPYKRLIDAGRVSSVMVAHAAFPKLDLQETDQNGKLLPSSLSYNVVSELLRGELGFDGLVITDDMEMGAILKTYGIGEACRRAILAGEDMLSICAGVEAIYDGYNAVSHAVASGEISEDRLDLSLARIAAAKSKLSEPLPFDLSRLQDLSSEIAALNHELN